jgi:hypothetical protein
MYVDENAQVSADVEESISSDAVKLFALISALMEILITIYQKKRSKIITP